VDARPAVAPDAARTATADRPAAVAWVALLAVALVWGAGIRARPGAHVGAAPFVGTWQPALGWRLLPAAAFAVVAVRWGPGLARRLSWARLLAACWAAGLGWAVALALVDGPGALTAPLATRYDYLVEVPSVGSPGAFLRGFVDAVPSYATHVKSHPPGMVLGLWVLDRAGLGGSGPAAALVLAVGASAAVAAVVAAREVVGEAAARRAAPFVALAPAAVFAATSADALFAGVTAWGAALVVLATGRRGGRSVALAAGGGVVLGAALFLSYGAVLVLLVPAAVAVARRRLDSMVLASAGAMLVAGAFAAAGFWWLDGLAAARQQYAAGLSGLRPYSYFVVANLAVLAVLLGPATAAALGRRGGRPAGLLVGAALAAVVAADLSGLSKGEVERIWLPFVPWLVVACCALADRPRAWLAANVGTGLALQVMLRSPW
jgi:hypothetical protein